MTLSNLEPVALGERLRTARSNANLTQDSVASQMELSRTTLVAIERGQRRVKPEEVVAFAKLYGVSVGRLTAADAIHVDLTAKFRRVEGREPGTEVTEAVALLNKLATGAAELERAVGAEMPRDYPPPVRIRAGGLYQQAEDAAVALRSRLGVGLGPINDLFSLFELDLGLRVFIRSLPGHVSGLYAFDPAIGACILVNAAHPWKRRVQTLAHEGGHFVADRSHADVLEENEVPESIEERFARRFGPALLMPAATVRTRFDQIVTMEKAFSVRQLVLLAHQFGVATEAMARRLEELDLLPNGTWESIRDRKFDSSYERQVLGDPAPEQAPAPIPARLAYLASVALEREILSEGQLCDLLVVDRVALWACLAAFPPSVERIET
jgi:Zn-dependent peptidase ImmA (M78 family)/transcriptional regulator with XRE-family HTH domain